MTEGEFKKRIHENFDVISKPVMMALEDIIEDAKKEIFPIPLGDLPFNPKTGQRDIIIHDLGDWLRFINSIRKWFGEAK